MQISCLNPWTEGFETVSVCVGVGIFLKEAMGARETDRKMVTERQREKHKSFCWNLGWPNKLTLPNWVTLLFPLTLPWAYSVMLLLNL